MVKSKKSTKRRSWKNDFLKLEKKYKQLEEKEENCLKVNKTITQKLEKCCHDKNCLQEALNHEREVTQKQVELITTLQRKNKTLKTRISQILNKNYFWLGGVPRIKLELQQLL